MGIGNLASLTARVFPAKESAAEFIEVIDNIQ
jgi:hypothetical protein